MSKIIFLNGCSSSGKTSIAKAIQYIASTPWLHLGVDSFINMLPRRFIEFGDKAKEGYYTFTSGENSRGSTIKVATAPLGEIFFQEVAPRIVNNFADFENNIIVDEVLFNDEQLENYATILSSHTVYFIKVICELKTMQEREIIRGNRIIGLANHQFDYLEKSSFEYDTIIDTTNTSSFENARKILTLISEI